MCREPRKLAAAMIAASMFASIAVRAEEPDVSRIALGKWTLAASATRVASDPADALAMTGFDPRGALEFSRATRLEGVQLDVRCEPASWLSLDLRTVALRARFPSGAYVPVAPERISTAGATVRTPDGWTASLLVNALARRSSLSEDSTPVKWSTFVNGRLSRNLTSNTRMTFDVFNVFDLRARNVDYFSTSRLWEQPGVGDSFFFNPAEPRGFRLKFRTTF